MSKNIVLCLDGTGSEVKARNVTNVLLTYEMLDLSDATKQVGFYDPGVGTFSAEGTWDPLSKRITKGLGLALGLGMKTNISEAYRFLMETYVPGDRVYLLGFSRGAYTTRALAGMSHRGGLMRQDANNMVPYLVRSYTKGDDWSGDDWKKVDRFAEDFSVRTQGSHSLPIHFMGLWDSVKALGLIGRDPGYPYTRQLPNAAHIYHAVSIDERRSPYVEYLVNPKHDDALDEVWFAGAHSDVGGTFDDKELSTIALKWIVDRALEHGIRLKKRSYEKLCTVDESFANGLVHEMGWIWRLLGRRVRPLPQDGVRMHRSVDLHRQGDPSYRLDVDDAAIEWVDDDWTTPSPHLSAGREA